MFLSVSAEYTAEERMAKREIIKREHYTVLRLNDIKKILSRIETGVNKLVDKFTDWIWLNIFNKIYFIPHLRVYIVFMFCGETIYGMTDQNRVGIGSVLAASAHLLHCSCVFRKINPRHSILCHMFSRAVGHQLNTQGPDSIKKAVVLSVRRL